MSARALEGGQCRAVPRAHSRSLSIGKRARTRTRPGSERGLLLSGFARLCKVESAKCRMPSTDQNNGTGRQGCLLSLTRSGEAVSGLCPPVSGETSFAAKSFVRYGYVYVYAWVCCFDRGRLGCSIYNSPCYARLDGLVRTARTHASCTMHPSL
jgi:hypothetical protein